MAEVKPVKSEAEEPLVGKARIEAHRGKRWTQGVDWPVAFWIGLLHVGALGAPFFFTWKGVAVLFFLWWLSGSVGICLGFHRLLTHAGFCTYRPVKWMLAFIGGLAGEGSAIQWVANHRKHHALSDKDGDPHSPLDGGFWSHMVWFMPRFTPEQIKANQQHWAPDLFRDPVLRFLDKAFIFSHLALGGLLLTIGTLGWDWHTGWSFVFYGMFLRLVLVLHSTWFVNSATHMWGYRNYETSDQSRNLWWVAILAYGEGWHNNHHAYPRMAMHGHKWWEFDATYQLVRLLRVTGLAWKVVDTIPTSKPR